ncbi:hypothetical protein [Winogradskyella flava]|uniref:Uncharacterized protein n=1 Tax=Winogradskyella flava TaxID=1884876 RepID=A0A842IRW3_9FLAO|nr:hypothetical protein [Winogradskyella flava]MBC2845611.1 hypothetical protein [Winogradskyella flava]
MSKKLDWLPYGMLPIPLIIELWEDEEKMSSFKNNPKLTLNKMGYNIDDSIEVKILENNERTVNLVIPNFPDNIKKMKKSDFDEFVTMTTKCGATGTCDSKIPD